MSKYCTNTAPYNVVTYAPDNITDMIGNKNVAAPPPIAIPKIENTKEY